MGGVGGGRGGRVGVQRTKEKVEGVREGERESVCACVEDEVCVCVGGTAERWNSTAISMHPTIVLSFPFQRAGAQ